MSREYEGFTFKTQRDFFIDEAFDENGWRGYLEREIVFLKSETVGQRVARQSSLGEPHSRDSFPGQGEIL